MKTVLHSISYAGGWGQKFLTLEEFIVKAKKLGYSAVELVAKRPHLSPLDYKGDELKNLIEILNENGMECAAIAGYTDFSNTGEQSMTPLTEMQLIYFESLCKIAKALGCGIIRIFTGFDYEDRSFWQQWATCVDAIRKCCDIADAYEVVVGLQNHHDIAVDTEALRDFICEVDRQNLKPMLDPWSLMINNEDPEEAIKLMGNSIIYSTFADYKEIKRYQYSTELINYNPVKSAVKAVKMGEGFIQVKNYLELLNQSGFDGYIAYEMCSPILGGGSEKNLDEYAKHFLEFVNSYV